MHTGSPLLLASIESIRPVFLIVMGVSLLMLAWRLSQNASGWTARFILAGAILLAIGYSFIMPLYEAGKIEHYSPDAHFHGDPGVALAWHVVKVVAMNTGWFLFGWGVALHAGLFERVSARPVLLPSSSPR